VLSWEVPCRGITWTNAFQYSYDQDGFICPLSDQGYISSEIGLRWVPGQNSRMQNLSARTLH
jgi:hypothetical protein